MMQNKGECRVLTIVGARPQFVKAGTVSRAIAIRNRQQGTSKVVERIVHTGQHYDPAMSKVFFEELEIPEPEVNLAVGSGSHGKQTGAMLERIESIIIEEKPTWVLIYGDTNSTLAGALAAAKLQVPIAHVEAGLRSYNRAMPEEINRVVADAMSTLLLCPTKAAVENLRKEGVSHGVHLVGDVMYDSVLFYRTLARERSQILEHLGLRCREYYLATIHRAENTDDPNRLQAIISSLQETGVPVILPLHPRTRCTLGSKVQQLDSRIKVIDPVPYLDMLTLESNARVIMTDSGGVQKEAFWLRVPCVTLRDETEWTELVENGYNRLAGADPKLIREAVQWAEQRGPSLDAGAAPELYGDGKSAERIVSLLAGEAPS